MSRRKRRNCARLFGMDRIAVQHGLDDGMGFREIAKATHRDPSTVSREVKRNRTLWRGGLRGGPVEEVPLAACYKLKEAPWVCNGCRKISTCGRVWQCKYSSSHASRLSYVRRSESRKGIDRASEQMEWAMGLIRDDLARGLSPCQIAQGRARELRTSPSTICRWMDKGYCGLSNMELRRKVGYKSREKKKVINPTFHGKHCSYETFMALSEETRATACETDTVIGRKLDRQCILTLYLKPSKLQLALLLSERTTDVVAKVLDILELLSGRKAFSQFFGIISTDNGVGFYHTRILERSKEAASKRAKVYYCDARQSQQKAGCERNHVELRKLLPKGAFAFDFLESRDLAIAMSHLNSQPRPSLGGLSPISLFKAQSGDDAECLLEGLGIELIPYSKLDLTEKAIDIDRAKRGAAPLERA